MRGWHFFLSSIGLLAWALCPMPASAQSGLMPSAAAPAPPTAATERGKPADPTVQLQLLEGVRLFRAEQYEDALRVFQKVEADQQPADIGFYLGMALHKLGRHTAALSAFRSAQRSGLREPVADYYAAVSCYRLGMTTRARRGFLALVGGGGSLSAAVPPLGPRLQQGARSFLSALQPAPQEPAAEGGIPITRLRHERARQAAERLLASDDPEAAIEWIDEALHVLEETADPRERAEHSDALRQTLSRLRGKLGPRTRGADVLALEQRLAQ